MKKYIVSSMAISFCLVLAGCNQFNWLNNNNNNKTINTSTEQTIALNLSSSNQAWNVVQKNTNKNQDLVVTMMPTNQNLSNWKEGIRTTTILYKNKSDVSAQNMVQNEMMRAKKYCGQVDGNIISQSTQSTTYQLNIQKCSGGYPDQIMFGKAFNGSDGVYAVRYSAKMGQVADSEINTMANVVKESQLVNNS